MIARLDEIWRRLPLQLQPRFRAHTRRLSTHDGKLTPQVGDLATLLAFALVADYERVIDGTWVPRL
jgi:hypothetical protein